jgi:hypothetical protein
MRLKFKKRWDGQLGVHEVGTECEVPHYLAEWLLKDGTAVQVPPLPVPVLVPVVVQPEPSPVADPEPSPHAALLSAP